MFLIAKLMQDFLLLRPPHGFFHHTNHLLTCEDRPVELMFACLVEFVSSDFPSAMLDYVQSPLALLSLTVDSHVGPPWSRKTKLNRQTAATSTD